VVILRKTACRSCNASLPRSGAHGDGSSETFGAGLYSQISNNTQNTRRSPNRAKAMEAELRITHWPVLASGFLVLTPHGIVSLQRTELAVYQQGSCYETLGDSFVGAGSHGGGRLVRGADGPSEARAPRQRRARLFETAGQF